MNDINFMTLFFFNFRFFLFYKRNKNQIVWTFEIIFVDASKNFLKIQRKFILIELMLINELFKIARVNFLLFPLIRKTWISKILNFKKTRTWIKIFINTRILKIFKFLIKFFSQLR